MKVDILKEILWFGGNSFHPLYHDENVFRMEAKLKAGKSVPAHYHKYFDEYWTVKKGVATFIVGKERVTKKSNETFFCARNIVHQLKNETEEDVVMITEMRPAADMAKMMAIIAGLQDDQEKAWMFKYFYIERKAELKEFSNPTGLGIRIAVHLLMPITMVIGKIKGWDKLIDKYI